MKTFTFLVILFITINTSIKAQHILYEYGKLESQEQSMKVSPIDPGASAVVIFDMGKIWFPRKADKFEVVFEKTTRIKILEDDGAKYATFTIPLYYEGNVKEKISSLEAIAWNLSGNVWQLTELPRREYQTEIINDNYMRVTVTIPNVQKGTIVEYKYTVSSPFFTPIKGWEFQNEIPTLFSLLEVRMIPFYEYTFLHQGKKPSLQESYLDKKEFELGKNHANQYGTIKYKEMIYLFGMNNMPASVDNITRIDFQLSNIIDLNGVGLKVSNTWERAIKDLLIDDKFGDFIDKSRARAKTIVELDYLESIDEASRLNSIVRLVKERYIWNGVLGKYAPTSINSFLETKTGNSGTINLFTIGLLRAAGIDAFPIILRTKDNHDIKTDYPFLHLYDYVLIGSKINGQIVLSDATDQLLPDDQLPLRCINMKGLIIEKNKIEWVTCTSPNSSYTNTSMVITIPEKSKSINVSLKKSAAGYDAYLLRDKYRDKKSEMINHYGEKGYKLDEKNIKSEDYTVIDKPYTIDIDFMLPLPEEAQTISIDPFLNEPINENPLKEQSRDYPTDFYYPINKSYRSEIHIPANYSTGKLPENFEINNSLIEMNYEITQDGQELVVQANYKFIKEVYPATEYIKIKGYLAEIVRRFNEPVLLVKTNQ